MKTNTLFIVLSSLIITSVYAQKSKIISSEHLIDFKKHEILVVAVADQKPGKETELQDYFNTIMPTAMKNGLSFVGQLHIDKVVKADNYDPNNFIGLFKWPNMQSAMTFGQEFPPNKIKELRIPIWNEFKGHLIAIQKDETIKLNQDKTYEVKFVWSKKGLDAKAIKKNGGKIVLEQTILGYEDLNGHSAPNQLIIIEWASQRSADAFYKSHSLQLDKEEAFYTHFTRFPS